MKKMVKASTILIFIILLTHQCEGQLQIRSALHEVRTISLAKEFEVAISNYQISSTTQSPYQLIQPLISFQEDKFFASSRLLKQSQLQIDSQITQQLQLYYDFSLPEDQRSQMLSLIQIMKNDNVSTITEIAQLNLDQEIQGVGLIEVVLCMKNTGILLYSINGNYFVSLLQLDSKNKFQLFKGVQIQKKSQFLKYSVDLSSQEIYFMVQEIDTFKIQLRTINMQGQVSNILDEIQMCSYLQNPKVNYVDNYKQGFLVLCQEDNKFKYYLYYSDTNQNKIVQLYIQDTLNYQTSSILSSSSISNAIYLVQQLSNFQDQIRVTQLIINKNKQIITQYYNDISIPINTKNIINTFISIENDFITLVTNNLIVGVCISESSVVFQIQNQQIPNYFAFASNIYGEQIAISYSQDSKTPNYITKLITTNIPKLTFTQISEQEQIYNIQFENDALKIQKVIHANLIVEDSNTVIIKNPNASFHTTQNSPQKVITMDIEKYFIGYITNGDISDTFQNATLQSLEKIFVQNSQEPSRIYSTFTQNYLTQSFGDSQNQSTITISSASFQDQQSYDYGKINLTTPILSVDEQSGYFLNTNNRGEKQINVFFYQKQGDKVYQFATLNPSCDGQSLLLYSGDILNNQVVVLCDKSLKVYRFSYLKDFIVNSYNLDYPTDKIAGTITKIEIQPSGLLYITDNQSIIAIEVNKNFFVGLVQIPSNPLGLFTGQVIFFSESFIVARNDNNSAVIQQFSYCKFNGTKATIIRTFLNFGQLNWIGNQLQSIKNFSLNSNQEFLIVDTKIDDNNIKKLFFRVSISGDIQAQNQLFTAMNLVKSTPFFAVPQMVGYFQNRQFVFFKLYYQLTLQAQIKINPTIFQSQITNKVTGLLTLNEKYQMNLTLYYYRSVQAFDSQILNVSDFQNDLSKMTIQAPFSYQFDDRQFSNGHLLGWKIIFDYSEFSYALKITQRIDEVSQMALNLQESFNQIIVMPNALMYSTSKGVFVEQLSLSSVYQPNCQFFIEDGELNISQTKEGQSIIKKSIYTISLDYQHSSIITLTNYKIQGTYNQYPTSQPTISLVQQNVYTYDSKIFQNQSIITIASDNNLGLLALLQEKGSSFSQICKIQLSLKTYQNTFSLDCSIYSSISNLLIINIIYIQSLSLNLFVSYNQKIYYGFSQDLSKYSAIDFKNFFAVKGVQLQQQINYSQKFSESSILISYSQGNSFILTLEFDNNQISIKNNIQTLHAYNGLQFIGVIYTNQQNQIFSLLKSINDPTTQYLVLYEQYSESKTDYLIRSSESLFNDNQELLQPMISQYKGYIILGMNGLQQDSTIPSTFNLQEKPQIDITYLEYSAPVSSQTSKVFSFAIRPLFQPDKKIELKTNFIANARSTFSNSNALSYQRIFILIFLCFI